MAYSRTRYSKSRNWKLTAFSWWVRNFNSLSKSQLKTWLLIKLLWFYLFTGPKRSTCSELPWAGGPSRWWATSTHTNSFLPRTRYEMRGALSRPSRILCVCGATDFSSSQIVNLSFYTLHKPYDLRCKPSSMECSFKAFFLYLSWKESANLVFAQSTQWLPVIYSNCGEAIWIRNRCEKRTSLLCCLLSYDERLLNVCQ